MLVRALKAVTTPDGAGSRPDISSEKGASHCPFLLIAGSRPRKLAERIVKIYTRIRGLKHERGLNLLWVFSEHQMLG